MASTAAATTNTSTSPTQDTLSGSKRTTPENTCSSSISNNSTANDVEFVKQKLRRAHPTSDVKITEGERKKLFEHFEHRFKEQYEEYKAALKTSQERQRAAQLQQKKQPSQQQQQQQQQRAANVPPAANRNQSKQAAPASNKASVLTDILKTADTLPTSRRVQQSIRCEEDQHVPRLFAKQLSRQTQDTSGGRLILMKIPPVGFTPSGCNTLVLQCETKYAQTSTHPIFACVNVAINHEDIKDRIMLHLNLRAKKSPMRGNDQVKYTVLQGYKEVQWQCHSSNFPKGIPEVLAKPGEKFWLRIHISPQGYCTYINGKLIAKTPHPPHHTVKEGDEPWLHIPTTGDIGEKSTLVIHGVWMGYSEMSAEVAQKVYNVKPPKPDGECDSRYIYIKNLPDMFDREELTKRISGYQGASIDQFDPSSGTATVALEDKTVAKRAIEEMNNAVIMEKTISVVPAKMDQGHSTRAPR